MNPLLRDWLVTNQIVWSKVYSNYCCKVLKGSKTAMHCPNNRGPESPHSKAMKAIKNTKGRAWEGDLSKTPKSTKFSITMDDFTDQIITKFQAVMI